MHRHRARWSHRLGVRTVVVAAIAASMTLGGWASTEASASTTTVTTWTALVSAFKATGTVKLTASITAPSGEDLVVPSGVSVILDLNGQTLTITSPGATDAAIEVKGALTIETTASGSGTLTATGGLDGAGIGGGLGGSGGSVTIGGGTVHAKGGEDGAGIGGGNQGSGGTITITGGTVHAQGANTGAGIGGGLLGSGGTITISRGAFVSSNGGFNGAGIGGGTGGSGGTITISGGTVHASGGTRGAGIGGGTRSAGGTITLRGGTVHAQGGSTTGAGIGGGYNGPGGTVTISGGAVTAEGGSRGAGIGGGTDGKGGTFTITGGTVHATGGLGGAGIGGGLGGSGGTAAITGGDVTAAGTSASAVGAGTGGASFGSLTNGGFLTLKGYEENIPSGASATNTVAGVITLDTGLSGPGTLVNTGTLVLGIGGSVTGVTVTEHDYVVTFTTSLVETAPPPETVYASSFTKGEVMLPAPPSGYEWADNASSGAQVTAASDLTTLFGESASGATTVTLYLATAAPPAFTSPPVARFPRGPDSTFTVTASGDPTPTITERGTLPSGLSFETNGDGTATISGTPSPRDKRSYSIRLTATNGVSPPAVQRLTIDIGTRPVYKRV